MRPQRWLWTPATLQRLRVLGDARLRAQSVALLVYSARGMRFQPPPSTQEYQLGARCVRPVPRQRALLSFASAALRFPQPPARGKSSTRAEKDSGRGQRAYAPPRLAARSEGVAGLQDSAQSRRSSGRRALRVWPAQHRAFSQASRGRARRARFRPQLLCTSRGPQLLSDRRETSTMTTHKTGTREQWEKARLELLKAEKELTRRSDELARQRQELPWVPINKGYRFDTDEGGASLADFFRGRSQLLVYHFMFGPDYAAGCPSGSSIAGGVNGISVHLANHDVMLWAVSRAPLAKLQA